MITNDEIQFENRMRKEIAIAQRLIQYNSNQSVFIERKTFEENNDPYMAEPLNDNIRIGAALMNFGKPSVLGGGATWQMTTVYGFSLQNDGSETWSVPNRRYNEQKLILDQARELVIDQLKAYTVQIKSMMGGFMGIHVQKLQKINVHLVTLLFQTNTRCNITGNTSIRWSNSASQSLDGISKSIFGELSRTSDKNLVQTKLDCATYDETRIYPKDPQEYSYDEYLEKIGSENQQNFLEYSNSPSVKNAPRSPVKQEDAPVQPQQPHAASVKKEEEKEDVFSQFDFKPPPPSSVYERRKSDELDDEFIRYNPPKRRSSDLWAEEQERIEKERELSERLLREKRNQAASQNLKRTTPSKTQSTSKTPSKTRIEARHIRFVSAGAGGNCLITSSFS